MCLNVKKHFEAKYMNGNQNRTRLNTSMNYFPTIHTNQKNLPCSPIPTIVHPRRPPHEMNNEDEANLFSDRKQNKRIL